MVGLFNACYALLVAWAVLIGRRRFVLRLVIALLLAGLVAFPARHVLDAVFGEDGELSAPQWAAQAGFQVVLLLLTLVPLRVARRRHAVADADPAWQDTPRQDRIDK